jgi:hypothetical protein
MQYGKPVVAGQFLIMDAAGFGPVLDDSGFPGEQNKLSDAVLSVGGVETPVLYAGRHPERPGFDRIIFEMPEGVAPGCIVPVFLRSGETESEPAFLAVSNDPAQPCEHPAGYGLLTLLELDRGGTVTVPDFRVQESVLTFESEESIVEIADRQIHGSILQYDREALENNAGIYFQRYSANGCTLLRYDSAASTTGLVQRLDAGESLRVTGPSGDGLEVPRSEDNEYSLVQPLEEGEIPGPGGLLPAGSYLLESAGGRDITPFRTSLQISPPIDWLNLNSIQIVNRAEDLLVTWSPGAASDLVTISGVSGYIEPVPNPDGEPGERTIGSSFVCQATADRGAFRVPAEILQAMPASSAFENPLGLLFLSHQGRSPNGSFRVKTSKGLFTELGQFQFERLRAKVIAWE